MAPAGLEGGGSMTQQEIDQVIVYLEHIQVTQDEALLKIEGRVQGALDRIIDGENRVDLAILEQTAERDDILAADGILEEHRAFLAASPALRGDRLDDAVRTLLSADGTCTDESAALAGTTCDVAGADADRDGITDDAERALTAVAEHALDTLTSRSVQAVVADDGTASNEIVVSSNEAYDVTFDPGAGFSNTSVTGEPIADFVELEAFLETLDTDLLTTVLISERLDTFLGGVDGRLAFLRASLAQRRWIPVGVTVSDGSADFGELASQLGTDEASAERAVGLFNGYCARCHTGGYSAGVATEQEPGSGAWAPALRDGRSTVQFPDAEDQVGFIIRGSEFGVNYGVNGLGNGKMPGFGQILSLEDIELIVAFERSL
jgi:mono/diheme cytochrome c family protein